MPGTEGAFLKVIKGLLNLQSKFIQKREVLYLTSLWQKKRELITEINSNCDFGVSDHMTILAMPKSKTISPSLHTDISHSVLAGFCTFIYKP